MRKTLTQALLAAFCAILACAALEGGGVMLINLRNGMMGGRRMPTAKDYVCDVANWDAIENAGYSIHDGTAATWKDLSGNGYDFSLNDGMYSWLSDAITGAATAKSPYYIGQVTSAALGISAKTMECVCELPGAYQILAVLGRNASNRRGNCIIGPTIVDANTGNVLVVPQEYVGTRVSLCIIYDDPNNTATATSLFINGVEQTLRKDLAGQNCYNGYYPYPRIGGRGTEGGCMLSDAKICCMRLSSYTLDASVRAANYAIDKVRFNLPDAS